MRGFSEFLRFQAATHTLTLNCAEDGWR